MIIAVDHGYGYMKTVHFAFPTGIVKYEHEPYTLQKTLAYQGAFYVCGSGRQSIVRDKTRDDSYYLLTLAAIAKEMKYRTGALQGEIVLAAGLPLTRFGLDKESFKAYLLHPQDTQTFHFEGEPYAVRITNVLLYPQGYSAVVGSIQELRREPSVVICDIGSWTIDVMRLDNGIPNADACRSLELGMIRCVNEITEQVRRGTGLSVTDAQAESILLGKSGSADSEVCRIVTENGEAYAQRIVNTLLESGFDVKAVPVVFLGGGARFIERYADPKQFCAPRFITDIHANAKGYEYIAKQAYPDE